MKHEDDLSDDFNQPLNENGSGWLDNDQIDKKDSGRSFIRDPYLDHAAGDYEPLQDDSRYRHTDNVEQIPKERIKFSSLQPQDSQMKDDERLQSEQDNRAEKIEEIRASFGAMDHDRP